MSGKQMTLFEESEIQWGPESHKPIFSEWSYSRREMLEQCARKYYYQYYGSILKKSNNDLQKKKLHFSKNLQNRHLRTGSILHFVIRTYLNKLRQGEQWSLDRLLSWVRNIYREDIEYSRRYKRGMPLSNGKPRVSRYFWQPYFKKVIDFLPPALQFADGFTLAAPQQRSSSEFQTHYKQRLPLLRKVGCLEVPISMERTVNFAIPTKVREEMRGRLIMDVTEHLKQLTKKQIHPEIVPYDTLDEVFSELNRHSKPGIIVFVFDDQSPETYYKVAFELPNWRVKRITLKELENKFGKLKSTSNHGASQLSKSERGWNSFTEMITLDVLQQMDCIPWGFKDKPPYDAHLAIDVGRNKRDFALSLLTFHPSLSIRTSVQRKIDSKHETINELILHEEIVKLFKKVEERTDFQMPHSLLILRDGRECGRELEGINKAKEELIEKKLLAKTAEVDVVDFHKSIKKGIRLWERAGKNRVEQILEGIAFFLDDQTVVLTTTGSPTLRQGTAAPVMLASRSGNIDMERITKAVYASTHLNFSNPNVAQKLPLELKRTDDELKSRDSQEIPRRIST